MKKENTQYGAKTKNNNKKGKKKKKNKFTLKT